MLFMIFYIMFMIIDYFKHYIFNLAFVPSGTIRSFNHINIISICFCLLFGYYLLHFQKLRYFEMVNF